MTFTNSSIESVITQLGKSNKTNADIFCTQMDVPFGNLSLSVDSVGVVTFPITPKMAKSLIVEAEPARYGLKAKTLLDRNVRDTWEIPKTRIHTDLAWDAELRKALLKIQKDLNLPEEGILTADLHNLLIYMPGQFFKAHQDSEKSDGMLATLVIVLPSDFTGGELVINQHRDQRVFDFSGKSTNLNFVAFYTDCYHEVKEVTSGYRLALTYNLFFKSQSQTLKTHRNLELEEAMKKYFSQHSERAENLERPQWLVYLLDHEYTQSSLDWPHLRGMDRKRAGELLACADHLGLTAHLSLADMHETWSAEEKGDWGERYRRPYRDDDYEEAAKFEDYVLTELIQDEIILRHWIARSGKKFEDRNKYVPNEIVCWTKAADQFKPFKSEYEGYQGNYGNTLDRWYHRAAIILWKKETDLISLFTCDKTEALRIIGETLKNDLSEGQQMLRQIIPYWPEKIFRVLDPGIVLEFVLLVQNEELASILVKTVGIGSLREKNLSSLMSLMELYGEEWFIYVLTVWREHQEWCDEDSVFKELSPLVNQLAQRYKKISHWILKDQLSLVISNDVRAEDHLDRKIIRERLPQKILIITTLLEICQSVGEIEIHDKLVEHILKKNLLYPVVELVNLFMELDEKQYAQPLMHLKHRLEKQVSVPRKDGDWSIQDIVPDDCSDCEYLKNFLLSSSTQKLVWPLAKDRRAHIHGIIDSMDIPVTHETLRQGSPHKLVLTKKSELFTRDKKQAKIIESCLTKLRQMNSDHIA
ncbi:MAG: 2OG-Fe(II) oxygenase [Pseudobdellovibrionaceae bacterium]